MRLWSSRAVSFAIVSTAAAAEARIRSAERRAAILENRIAAQPSKDVSQASKIEKKTTSEPSTSDSDGREEKHSVNDPVSSIGLSATKRGKINA